MWNWGWWIGGGNDDERNFREEIFWRDNNEYMFIK